MKNPKFLLTGAGLALIAGYILHFKSGIDAANSFYAASFILYFIYIAN